MCVCVCCTFHDRRDRDICKRCDPLPGQQWTGVCHFRPARAALLPDSAHGTRGSPRGLLETAGFCCLGSQTGESRVVLHESCLIGG